VAQGGLWVLGPDIQLFLEFGFEFGDYGMVIMFWGGQIEIFGLGVGEVLNRYIVDISFLVEAACHEV
jgi:hypothetical protein